MTPKFHHAYLLSTIVFIDDCLSLGRRIGNLPRFERVTIRCGCFSDPLRPGAGTVWLRRRALACWDRSDSRRVHAFSKAAAASAAGGSDMRLAGGSGQRRRPPRSAPPISRVGPKRYDRVAPFVHLAIFIPSHSASTRSSPESAPATAAVLRPSYHVPSTRSRPLARSAFRSTRATSLSASKKGST